MAVVKVGVFCVYRVYADIYGTEVLSKISGEEWAMILASATILISSLIALSQDNLKRRLAFSTIGQLDTLFWVRRLPRTGGRVGPSAYCDACMWKNHIVFLCRSIFVATGKKYVSQLRGLGRRMPITMGAFMIGSLSVIGLPPLGDFISKWYLALGALDRDAMWVVAVY